MDGIARELQDAADAALRQKTALYTKSRQSFSEPAAFELYVSGPRLIVP